MPEFIRFLPHVNAGLNATCALFLISGYISIRRRNVKFHRACMISALSTSAVFLCSYLTYHYFHGSTRFPATGWIRSLYLAILLTHTVLAAVIVPLVLVTASRAFREDFARHRKIARWTLPMWLYVSITGVIVYVMLYHLYPAR